MNNWRLWNLHNSMTCVGFLSKVSMGSFIVWWEWGVMEAGGRFVFPGHQILAIQFTTYFYIYIYIIRRIFSLIHFEIDRISLNSVRSMRRHNAHRKASPRHWATNGTPKFHTKLKHERYLDSRNYTFIAVAKGMRLVQFSEPHLEIDKVKKY